MGNQPSQGATTTMKARSTQTTTAGLYSPPPPPPPPPPHTGSAARSSVATGVPSHVTSAERNGTETSQPPLRDDPEKEEEPEEDCTLPPCLAWLGWSRLVSPQLRTTFLPTRGRETDPIGSPLPDTPLVQRKRRQQVQEALRQEVPTSYVQHHKNGGSQVIIHNGQAYFRGLEKERSSLNGGSSSFLEPPEAVIHEGPDCERLLHEKYQLLEVLGVGSTSTVHKCALKHCPAGSSSSSSSPPAEYACKVIDCLLMEERFQGMMEQFQTEIEALRQLKHPNIIRLYDVYMTSDKIYIMMELMLGGELFDYVVEKGTLTEQEAAGIVRQVTSALVYMHSLNIVHRDLKPENLLLKHKPLSNGNNSHHTNNNNNNLQASGDSPVEVKIIDFGLSKALEEPVARTFLGTRGYLAPEMLQRRDYTKAVDTWALGVIVFVLLCGCLPFDDDSSTVPSDDLVRAKFVLRFPRWAKNLSLSAKDLLSHLLDVNPRTRYTAEQAMDHPWVRGVTAPKDILLASPGRIRKSPALRAAAQAPPRNTTGRGGGNRYYTPSAGRRGHHGGEPVTPPTPTGPMVRKTSI